MPLKGAHHSSWSRGYGGPSASPSGVPAGRVSRASIVRRHVAQIGGPSTPHPGQVAGSARSMQPTAAWVWPSIESDDGDLPAAQRVASMPSRARRSLSEPYAGFRPLGPFSVQHHGCGSRSERNGGQRGRAWPAQPL